MSRPEDRNDDTRPRDDKTDQRPATADPLDQAAKPDPKAGLDREVGDLEDPDAEADGAVPGRAGGGLAGG
ncbi:hypothetical protein BGP89_04225 [Luteimonas sp. JM171]|uniref:hypothetical protein n=1 Tax=Luteimonas sp. JM171 TaxID=1896164 RepID=UPI000A49BDD6|nr:hypothetical protein [Luteimonas sp. JM171]